MRSYFLPIDHRWPDLFVVIDSFVRVFRNVTFRKLESVEKHGLERFSKNFLVELNRPCGVLDNLCCFDARKLIPVMEWICGILQFYKLEPGVLPWWLVKVTMDADIPVHQSRISFSNSRTPYG